MKRTIGKLRQHLSLLNCEVDCIHYDNDIDRYIPTHEIHSYTLSKMLHETENPPDSIIESMRTGIFYGLQYPRSTSDGFGRILLNIGDEYEIKNLLFELREIIENDPFMDHTDRKRLLRIRNRQEFLFACFKYTLIHKGNTGKRMKVKEARLIQEQAKSNVSNISTAAQKLYDEEEESAKNDSSV